MRIIKSIPEMHEHCKQLKRDGKTIASVDTSGILHKGHMHLVEVGKENADVVIVNVDLPLEFFNLYNIRYNSKDELDRIYTDDHLKKDIELCTKHNVDVFFVPTMEEMYGDTVTKITFSNPFVESAISKGDTQALIPEHMASYIKDFNILMPDVAVLGQKDIYQTLSTIAMIKDFNFPIKPIIAPIIRESDGLACSSRNRFLTQSERQDATSIYQTLQEVSSWSETEPINYIKLYITHHVKADYCFVNIYCAETLKDLVVFDRKALIIINISFGNVYLSDNIIIEPK